MKIWIDPAFPDHLRSALETYARAGRPAIEEITKTRSGDLIVHAMTPSEVKTEIYAPEGGGAGYFDTDTGRLAVNPRLDTWRAIEVLCEEWIHQQRPEWSETKVRGSAVPAALRATLGRRRLPRRPGP